MTKTSISLQDLRRRIYLKAKADQDWRFWGLYVHVCKPETLREAYETARRNGGAAGIDGVDFAAIEEAGLEAFLDGIRDELVSRTYRPSENRQVLIPKEATRVSSGIVGHSHGHRELHIAPTSRRGGLRSPTRFIHSGVGGFRS